MHSYTRERRTSVASNIMAQRIYQGCWTNSTLIFLNSQRNKPLATSVLQTNFLQQVIPVLKVDALFNDVIYCWLHTRESCMTVSYFPLMISLFSWPTLRKQPTSYRLLSDPSAVHAICRVDNPIKEWTPIFSCNLLLRARLGYATPSLRHRRNQVSRCYGY